MGNSLDSALSLSRSQQPLDHMQYFSDKHIGGNFVVFIFSPIDNCICNWGDKGVDVAIVQNNFRIMSIGFASLLDIFDLVLELLLDCRFFASADNVDQIIIHLRMLLDAWDVIENQIVLEIALTCVQHQRLILYKFQLSLFYLLASE